MPVPTITEDIIQQVVNGDARANADRFLELQPHLVAFAERVFTSGKLPENVNERPDLQQRAYLAGMTFALECVELALRRVQ